MIMKHSKNKKVKVIVENNTRCIGKNKNGKRCKRYTLCGDYCRIHFNLMLKKEAGTKHEQTKKN